MTRRRAIVATAGLCLVLLVALPAIAQDAPVQAGADLSGWAWPAGGLGGTGLVGLLLYLLSKGYLRIGRPETTNTEPRKAAEAAVDHQLRRANDKAVIDAASAAGEAAAREAIAELRAEIDAVAQAAAAGRRELHQRHDDAAAADAVRREAAAREAGQITAGLEALGKTLDRIEARQDRER